MYAYIYKAFLRSVGVRWSRSLYDFVWLALEYSANYRRL